MPVILASVASISGGSVSLRGRSRASACRPARLVTTAAVPSRSGIPDSQRIVITGVGCVTPLGNDPKIFYDNLVAGKSGVNDLVETFPKDGYPPLRTPAAPSECPVNDQWDCFAASRQCGRQVP